MGALEARIAELSQPLEAKPTGVDPVLPKLPGVRAVVFDVYGTLLVSGSGDISLASEGSREDAACDALLAVFPELRPPENDQPIVTALHGAIRQSHADSASDHPEVEIRVVWQSVLGQLGVEASGDQVEKLAIEYECRVNPIWPMPALSETLEGLRDAGRGLGIVSNAQFFTPLAFEPLSGKSLAGWGFDPKICVWSYEHREAKPGTFLYERCVEALAEQGIEPGEALFVGNDLRNDVWPAQQVGMRAALFAGDERSLRLREDDPRLAAVTPDAVVTRLDQLLGIVL